LVTNIPEENAALILWAETLVTTCHHHILEDCSLIYFCLPSLNRSFFCRVIDGSDTLDELEKLPVNPKNYKPLTDTRINSITIHANPLAG